MLRETVLAYAEANFQGAPLELSPGRLQADQFGGARNIRSLKIPSGWVVSLFDGGGFQGNQSTFDADNPDIIATFGGAAQSIIVTIATHEGLYRRLRALSLARHFALGRYWRRNLASQDNKLGAWRGGLTPRRGGPRGVATHDCGDTGWRRPTKSQFPFQKPEDLYSGDTDLRDRPDLDVERWRVFRRGDENFIMSTGYRVIGLCVEHLLGHADAAQLVQITLDTLGSLYKFNNGQHPGFEGYILRWDPSTTDTWSSTVDRFGVETPQLACEFFLNADFKTHDEHHYSYCTLLDDPRYTALPDKRSHRIWEPSMDEYVGLITAYFMIWYAFSRRKVPESPAILAAVKDQAGRVGRYLQNVGYLLRRPCGDFTIYGAAGFNPCMEFPFNRVLKLITGDDFSVDHLHNTFTDAVERAGLGVCWHRTQSFSMARARDVLKTVPPENALKDLLGPNPWERLKSLLNGDLTETDKTILEAAQAAMAVDCFTEQDPNDRWEFAAARIWKALCIIPRQGFDLWMKTAGPAKSLSFDAFKPWIGLTALALDGVHVETSAESQARKAVRDAYLDWYNGGPPSLSDPDNQNTATFANGVALLLHADLLRETFSPEAAGKLLGLQSDLTDKLEAIRRHVVEENNCNLPLAKGDDPPEFTYEWTDEFFDVSRGYGPALALAWLYRSALEGLVDAPLGAVALPDSASLALWPRPAVPKEVIAAALTTRFPVPLNALKNGMSAAQFTGHDDIDLFEDPPAKPNDNDLGIVPPPQPTQTHRVELRDGVWDLRHLRDPSQEARWDLDPPPATGGPFTLAVIRIDKEAEKGLNEVSGPSWDKQANQLSVRVTFKRNLLANPPGTGKYFATYVYAWVVAQ